MSSLIFGINKITYNLNTYLLKTKLLKKTFKEDTYIKRQTIIRKQQKNFYGDLQNQPKQTYNLRNTYYIRGNLHFLTKKLFKEIPATIKRKKRVKKIVNLKKHVT